MKKTRQVGISFPLDLLELVDKKRGLIPRSKYIVAIVEKCLREARETNSKPRKGTIGRAGRAPNHDS